VHWGGYPCNLAEIQIIAKKHGLVVIEDAAQALGATYQNKPIGSISDFTCFSFQAIKHLTTGDGGAICCKDKTKYQQAIKARWFGIDRTETTNSVLGERQFDISTLGYKFHLNDYAAALGLANLETLPDRIDKRQEYAQQYIEAFKNLPGITLFDIEPDRTHAYWFFGFHVEDRENFIRALQSNGIQTSVVHQRIDRNSIFGDMREDLPEQSRFDATQINIPLHDGLDNTTVDYIIKTVQTGW
jgi:perosamine synthetase